MGTAPENQATNVHYTSLVRVIRRGKAVRPLSPHARSLADLVLAVGDVRLRAAQRAIAPALDRKIHHRDARRRRATTRKLKEALA